MSPVSLQAVWPLSPVSLQAVGSVWDPAVLQRCPHSCPRQPWVNTGVCRASETQTVYLLPVSEDVPQHRRGFLGKDVLQQINNFAGGDEDGGAAAGWLQGTAQGWCCRRGSPGPVPWNTSNRTRCFCPAQRDRPGADGVGGSWQHPLLDPVLHLGQGLGLGRRGCTGAEADVSCIITESFRMENTLKIESNCKPNIAEESLGPTSLGWCLLQWTIPRSPNAPGIAPVTAPVTFLLQDSPWLLP